MLAIRMQRTGRKGHAQFRVIVQEARLSPASGRVVAILGNYDPHAKTVKIDKEKAQKYLDNGAQPSPRVAVLLKSEGVKLPSWVQMDSKKKSAIKNVEKLRRNRPAEAEASKEETSTESANEATDAPAPEPVEEPAAEEPVAEAAAPEEAAAEPAEEAAPSETPAE